MTFGGQVWPIDPADLNLGPAPGGGCVGGIVEFPSSSGPGSPTWILGSAFLVRVPPYLLLVHEAHFFSWHCHKKNVYTVLRASPLSIGFAEVADVPGRDPGTPLSTLPPESLLTSTITDSPLPSVPDKVGGDPFGANSAFLTFYSLSLPVTYFSF
jgi:hypothetical protein